MAGTLAPLAVASQPPVERLSLQDLANLVIEARDTPMHMAVLLIVDGRSLGIGDGDDLVERARSQVESRLDRLPELRQVLYRPDPPARRPVWVDDRSFRIERHVKQASVSRRGDAGLFALTEHLLQQLLDRDRPLWELWVITGLSGRRFALLLKVHHAVTDGRGMLRIADALFDAQPDKALHATLDWAPAPVPSWGRLVASSASQTAGGLWRFSAGLLDPIRFAGSAAGLLTTAASVTGRTWRGRRAALRHPIRAGRKLAVVHLELAAVKRVAHAHGATVNDVVLDLAAAGIAAVLRCRGEAGEGVVLRILVAVDPPPNATGNRHNRAGAVVVSVPLYAAPGTDRLRLISEDSRRARRWQHASMVERSLVLVTRTRLGRFLSRRQGAVDMAISNLRGPAAPIYFVGAEVLDAIPMTPISGNVTIDLCALSYAGRFNIGVLADAATWPDLDVAARAMCAEWAELQSARPSSFSTRG